MYEVPTEREDQLLPFRGGSSSNYPHLDALVVILFVLGADGGIASAKQD